MPRSAPQPSPRPQQPRLPSSASSVTSLQQPASKEPSPAAAEPRARGGTPTDADAQPRSQRDARPAAHAHAAVPNFFLPAADLAHSMRTISGQQSGKVSSVSELSKCGQVCMLGSILVVVSVKAACVVVSSSRTILRAFDWLCFCLTDVMCDLSLLSLVMKGVVVASAGRARREGTCGGSAAARGAPVRPIPGRRSAPRPAAVRGTGAAHRQDLQLALLVVLTKSGAPHQRRNNCRRSGSTSRRPGLPETLLTKHNMT